MYADANVQEALSMTMIFMKIEITGSAEEIAHILSHL